MTKFLQFGTFSADRAALACIPARLAQSVVYTSLSASEVSQRSGDHRRRWTRLRWLFLPKGYQVVHPVDLANPNQTQARNVRTLRLGNRGSCSYSRCEMIDGEKE